MREPGALSPSPAPGFPVEIIHEPNPRPELYRALYLGVGGAYYWTDRAAWTDEEIAAHLARPEIAVWVARVEGAPAFAEATAGNLAGYFELRRCDDGSVEIAYFGLMPAFVGRGLGGYLLTRAVEEAWALGPARVWLHTSTLDHEAALTNYLRRGFAVTRVEDYDVT